ncbi:hypothetical protein [Halogeometricum luteum]|uniref:DUF5658 domain-containing protein n=1 Tax=Halogeometricum luteum TaxID=2950537 RepID=A0ABU2G6P0_9EURY|nr:hypothetical protein [Halogeometricum sp. S3BR5-2]MDS0295899.1 hypothetical protein [Halogeometricum sp. S3BR5-2]
MLPVTVPSLPVPALDAALWLSAVALYGVGDYVTTVAAVTRPGARERNPFVRRLFDVVPLPPSVSFAALKLVAFACFAAGYLSVDAPPFRPLVPALVAAVGALVTAQNVRVLSARRSPPR